MRTPLTIDASGDPEPTRNVFSGESKDTGFCVRDSGITWKAELMPSRAMLGLLPRKRKFQVMSLSPGECRPSLSEPLNEAQLLSFPHLKHSALGMLKSPNGDIREVRVRLSRKWSHGSKNQRSLKIVRF